MDRAPGTRAMRSCLVVTRHLAARAGAPPGPVAEAGPDRLSQAVARIVAVTAGTAGPQLVPVLRSGILGKTFVYDPGAGKYVVDPARAGAPAAGVRFVLYDVGEGDVPVEPLRETGHADLVDQRASAPDAVGLRLTVVSDGVTHLDYAFALGGSIGNASFEVAGFLSDGIERVDFDVSAASRLFRPKPRSSSTRPSPCLVRGSRSWSISRRRRRRAPPGSLSPRPPAPIGSRSKRTSGPTGSMPRSGSTASCWRPPPATPRAR
jgi:hypothetical protein